MRFAELRDEQWVFIKPYIPPQPIVGRKRADDRKTINIIIYVLMKGCLWHDMLEPMVPIKQLGEGSNGGRRKVFGTRFFLQLRSMLRQSKTQLEIVVVDSTLIDSKVESPQDIMSISDAKE